MNVLAILFSNKNEYDYDVKQMTSAFKSYMKNKGLNYKL